MQKKVTVVSILAAIAHSGMAFGGTGTQGPSLNGSSLNGSGPNGWGGNGTINGASALEVEGVVARDGTLVFGGE